MPFKIVRNDITHVKADVIVNTANPNPICGSGTDLAVNTIQNWERTGKITKESLHGLLDLYGVDQMMRNRVVLSVFGDNCTEERSVGVDNFPYFLFKERPDIASAARREILSADEMELFGYSYYISNINGSNGDCGHGPRRWPIEYSVFKKYGGYFATMKMLEAIETKLGDYLNSVNKKPSLSRVAYNFGLRNPGTSFDYCALSKKEIAGTIVELPNLEGNQEDISELYTYCKCVEDPVALGTNEESYIKEYDDGQKILKSIVNSHNDYYTYRKAEYELKLNGIKALCFEIEKRESCDTEYLKEKEQYLSDRKAFDEHPGLYDREPSFNYRFTYYLRLTTLGEKYIKWYES